MSSSAVFNAPGLHLLSAAKNFSNAAIPGICVPNTSHETRCENLPAQQLVQRDTDRVLLRSSTVFRGACSRSATQTLVAHGERTWPWKVLNNLTTMRRDFRHSCLCTIRADRPKASSAKYQLHGLRVAGASCLPPCSGDSAGPS